MSSGLSSSTPTRGGYTEKDKAADDVSVDGLGYRVLHGVWAPEPRPSQQATPIKKEAGSSPFLLLALERLLVVSESQ